MVISEPSTAAGGPTPLKLKRQPFKSSRNGYKEGRSKGLSAFYSNKSQSFSCISDLQTNPFCQSSLVLAKRRSLSRGSWQKSFSCIEEDVCGVESLQQRQAYLEDSDPYCADPASAPGSPMSLLSPAGSFLQPWDSTAAPSGALADSWFSSDSKAAEVQPQQGLVALASITSGMLSGDVGGPCPPSPSSLSACGSSLPSTSSTSSSGLCMEAFDASAADMCDTYSGLYERPTEGLCAAMRAASLAVQQPHQAALCYCCM